MALDHGMAMEEYSDSDKWNRWPILFVLMIRTRNIQWLFEDCLQNGVNLAGAILIFLTFKVTKVGRVFRMVMSSEFRMGQYIDDDHREDVPHFIIVIFPRKSITLMPSRWRSNINSIQPMREQAFSSENLDCRI